MKTFREIQEEMCVVRAAIAEVVEAQAADLEALQAHYAEHQRVLREMGLPIDPVAMLNNMVADAEAVKARHAENRRVLEEQFAALEDEQCPHAPLVGLTAGAICPACETTL